MHRTLDEEIAAMIANAQAALAEEWGQHPWDYWGVLEWFSPVSAATANGHVERLLDDLHRTVSPAIHLVAGVHDDPGHLHAHVLLALTRRTRFHGRPVAEVAAWVRRFWPHGAVWLQPFNPLRSAGAVTYLARDPGTVVWG